MKRRAHIEYLGLTTVKVTTFTKQKVFNLADLQLRNKELDLIDLKELDIGHDKKFWVEISSDCDIFIYARSGKQESPVRVGFISEGIVDIIGVQYKGREATFEATIL